MGLCASECQLQTDFRRKKKERKKTFPAGNFPRENLHFLQLPKGERTRREEKRREEKRERERDGREESGSYRQRRASRPARLTLLFLSTRHSTDGMDRDVQGGLGLGLGLGLWASSESGSMSGSMSGSATSRNNKATSSPKRIYIRDRHNTVITTATLQAGNQRGTGERGGRRMELKNTAICFTSSLSSASGIGGSRARRGFRKKGKGKGQVEKNECRENPTRRRSEASPRFRGFRGFRRRAVLLSVGSGFTSLVLKGKSLLWKHLKGLASASKSKWPPSIRQVGYGLASLLGACACIDVGRFVTSIPRGPGGGRGKFFGLGWGEGGLGALADLYDTTEDSPSSRFIGSGAEPTVIYDVRGRVIATLMLSPTGEQNYYVDGQDGKRKLLPRGAIFGVPLRCVSDYAWQAIVASEDKRFFRHRGVDVFGLARAILSLGRLGGGSTITQQLAKNVALSHSRTLTRKAVELVLAMSIETKMNKRAILEAYLNSVYWGHGLWGIAGASAVYFRKKPSELKLGEAALLAGILPAPEHLSPFRNPEGALRARASVLQRMLSAGYITEEQALKAASRGLPESMSHGLVPNSDGSLEDSPTKSGVPFRAPFFVAEVLYQLRDLLRDNDVLRKGGLQIHTTLDLALQERAEQILQDDGKTRLLGEDKGESALVAMEPTTGAVRVLVGGRSYAKSPYNRAMLARRQPGSAFKPIVYLAALATGLVTPKTEVEDEEIVFRRDGASWLAISKKEKKRLLLENKRERKLQKEECKVEIKKLREKDEKDLKNHEDSKARVRKKLMDTQKRIAEYESSMDSGRESYFESLLSKSSNLEEELLELEEYSPGADPVIEELQHFIEESDTEEESDSDREEDYRPQNYNRKYRGVVTLRQSLAQSLNVPTVKLANLIGVENVIDMARKLGVRGKLPYELSLALGSCEVTPFEMAHAFNTIAAGGVCSRPHLITKVKDNSNHVLYRHKTSKKVVVPSHICADMHRMLRSAVTHGTGRSATKGWPAVAAAGKTGTSDNYRDAWFAGYTPSLTCVVWVGRDDNSSLPGSGSTLAAPVWARFMRAAQGSGLPTEKGMSKRKGKQRWRTISSNVE